MIDPETVHTHITHLGQVLGTHTTTRICISKIFDDIHYPQLEQNIAGITYTTPIGLSAGFDYEARLTQITRALGFGFHTIGTITNHAYAGNMKPRLGRLPQSQALLVNKGFKNKGVDAVITTLSTLHFPLPLGISIGRTNDASLSQAESIEDIMHTFSLCEASSLQHRYYELNISCPNLFGTVSFYSPQNLDDLLSHIDTLHIARPVYIKMPINNSNDEIKHMLDVILRHHITGVIFGNLQKDRRAPYLVPEEVVQFPTGNFSGKPTYQRSNELIRLTYQYAQDKLVIIGCGGVFSAEDAYAKIRNGASLVQLITGMIFKGPQLMSEINNGLCKLLQLDGYTHISQACGILAS